MRDGARIMMGLASVGVVTIVLLRALDSIPAALSAGARGVIRVASIADVQRRVDAPLLLPAYFPDTLRWPPTDVRFVRTPHPGVTLAFAGRQSGRARLIVSQSLDSNAAPGVGSHADVAVLHETSIKLEAGPGTLRRLESADGTVWQELTSTIRGRNVRLRYRGSARELIAIAQGLREDSSEASP
ncbi:MAG: hypothetical protein HYX76_12435 [Acidobacteria bacterium]|nr:hypothetical protein [Acidobacteriota bacterium]